MIHHPRDLNSAFAKTEGGKTVQYDLAFLDMNFSITTTGKAGLEALKEIKQLSPKLPVILITGWATVQLAVEGMKLGAADFIAKPWDNKALIASVQTQLSFGTPLNAHKELKGFDAVIGNSPAMDRCIALAKQIAPTDANVLITGESGTGKEVLAEAIHAASDRKDKAFIAVNLGGVPESLFESELFGHKAGAFTDAKSDRQGRISLAEGGTLFLDEIGDTPLNAQVKLLRVLQERTYEVLGESKSRRMDVRVICATHKDLAAMVEAGTFREDLYYRINLIQIPLPAVRQRGNDVITLAEYFLKTEAQKYQRELPTLSEGLKDWLRTLMLPGNVRQLRNLMERCVLLYEGELSVEQVSAQLTGKSAKSSAAALDDMTLDELEKVAIHRALDRNQGQIAGAARDLGVSRTALYRRLEKYGLG